MCHILVNVLLSIYIEQIELSHNKKLSYRKHIVPKYNSDKRKQTWTMYTKL